MCLSIPARIMEITGDTAKVSVGGSVSSASLMLLDDVKKGDYVLVHAGFAMEKLDEAEAIKTLALFQEIGDRLQEESKNQ